MNITSRYIVHSHEDLVALHFVQFVSKNRSSLIGANMLLLCLNGKFIDAQIILTSGGVTPKNVTPSLKLTRLTRRT